MFRALSGQLKLVDLLGIFTPLQPLVCPSTPAELVASPSISLLPAFELRKWFL